LPEPKKGRGKKPPLDIKPVQPAPPVSTPAPKPPKKVTMLKPKPPSTPQKVVAIDKPAPKAEKPAAKTEAPAKTEVKPTAKAKPMKLGTKANAGTPSPKAAMPSLAAVMASAEASEAKSEPTPPWEDAPAKLASPPKTQKSKASSGERISFSEALSMNRRDLPEPVVPTFEPTAPPPSVKARGTKLDYADVKAVLNAQPGVPTGQPVFDVKKYAK